MRQTLLRLSPVALAVLALCSCYEDSSVGPGCTRHLQVFGAFITDATGVPLVDLDPIVTLVRTGERLIVDSTQAPPNRTWGWYPIISDDEQHLLDPQGDSVRIAPITERRSGIGYYVFEPRCHVHKVSGPDTLVVR